MDIYYSLVILTIKLFLICESENIKRSFANHDLSVNIKQDGEAIQLKAYKSPENDLILKVTTTFLTSSSFLATISVTRFGEVLWPHL